MSCAFFLGAALFYLRFDDTRPKRLHRRSAFWTGGLSKNVTATLPVGLGVVLWLSARRLDGEGTRSTVPLLAVGIAAGALTVWFEHAVIGARRRFNSGRQRTLIAGRAVCFYSGIALWPANLSFNYPRWTIDATAWWQYLFPLASWRRSRWRGSAFAGA